MARPLRVGVDVTPLLGPRTGIGVYVANLVRELADRRDVSVHAAAFTVRDRGALRELPPTVRVARRPVPARLLHRAWMRGDVPRAAAVMGRADVVHGTNFVLPPPGRASGVITVHDLAFVRHPDWVARASLDYRVLVPRAIAAAGAVIVPTRAVAEELQDEYRVPSERIRAIPLGVDPRWREARTLPRPAGVPADYLVAVGTLEPRKGLDVLMDAYRLLLADDVDTPPLMLVGPRGWGEELDRRALPRDRVLLTGYLDDASVRALVGHARLLVFPSRYEGFGLPPIEALAAGTPVVASDIAAVREVVGGHVELAAPGDPVALAESLRRSLRSQLDANRVAAARAHVARYTWSACAAATAAVYAAAAG